MHFGSFFDSLSEHAMIAGEAIGLGPSLLVVDADREMRRTLVSYFAQRAFHVGAAASLASAKEVFATKNNWSVVVIDYHLPDGTGRDLAAWVRERNPEARVLLICGSAHVASLCAGEDFFSKPFRLEKLEAYIGSLHGAK